MAFDPRGVPRGFSTFILSTPFLHTCQHAPAAFHDCAAEAKALTSLLLCLLVQTVPIYLAQRPFQVR